MQDERVLIAATRLTDFDRQVFKVSYGTVQCYIVRDTPWTMIHFGGAEYAREKEILTPSRRAAGQAICDALNSGEISLDDAKKRLSRIW